MAWIWPLTMLAALVEAAFMALTVHGTGGMTSGGATLGSGGLAGFILRLGFVVPTSLTNKRFANPLTAWVLEAGNRLVTMALLGGKSGRLALAL